MNFRTTAILAAVLLVAAIAFFFVSNRPAKPDDVDQKVVDVDSANVTRIIVTPAQGKKLVLDKSGVDWKLVEPIGAPADKRLVDDLIRVVTDLKPQAMAEKSEFADIGIDKPGWTIELSAGTKTYKLRITERPIAGDAVYVLLDGQDRAARVSLNPLIEQLEKKPESFRSMQLVNAQSFAIQQMVITQMDGDKVGQKLVMQKTGGEWQLIEPEKLKLDANAMSDLTMAISNLTATSIVEEKSVPMMADPRRPTRTVWFSTAAPSTQPSAPATRPAGITIAFGGYESALKKNVFAYVESNKTFAKVVASSFDAFDKSILDLRDKLVADIDPAKVSAISIKTHRNATTRPTTQPASDNELSIERRKQNVVMATVTAVAATGLTPATLPTILPATLPTTLPVEKLSTWVYKTKADGESKDASDARVSALLAKFNPLRADKFVAAPASAEDETVSYTVEITSESAGSATTYQIRIADRGADKPLLAHYQDLYFQLSHTLAETLGGDFDAKAPPPEMPMMMPPGMGGMPGMGF